MKLFSKIYFLLFCFLVAQNIFAQSLIGFGGGLCNTHFIAPGGVDPNDESVTVISPGYRMFCSLKIMPREKISPEILIDAVNQEFYYYLNWYQYGHYHSSHGETALAYNALFTTYSLLINGAIINKDKWRMMIGGGPGFLVALGNYSGEKYEYSSGSCASCNPPFSYANSTTDYFDKVKYRHRDLVFNAHGVFDFSITERISVNAEVFYRISGTEFEEYYRRQELHFSLGLNYYIKPITEWRKKKTAE